MPDRIHIVHLINDLDSGGAERFLRDLIARSNGQAFSNTVVSLTGKGKLESELVAAGSRVFSLEMRTPFDIGALQRFRKILKQENPAILHCWMYHSNLLGTVATCLMGRLRLLWSVRSSLTRDHFHSALTVWIVRAGALLSSTADGILFNSEEGLRSHIQAGYSGQKAKFIPNGIDVERFRPNFKAKLAFRAKLGAPSDAVLIGMVGRYHPVKGVAVFLEAAKQFAIKENHRVVKFVLVGSNTSTSNLEFARMVENAQLGQNLVELGECSEVESVLAGLDILTSCSFREGFSNVVAEAMACGVPCVATDVGDNRTIIGPYGKIVPPGDPAKIAAAWRELIELGDQARQALSVAARERIKTHYSLEEAVEHYKDLYRYLAQDSV